jgi:arsenate reductase (thioredoxin)
MSSILFLCVHNAGRSQMAAGWARKLGGDRIEVFSGGSEPAEAVNKRAVEAMAEVGIDIANEAPKKWSDRELRAVDVVVTMGCGDTCPVYPGKRYVDWELDDPSGRSLEEVRVIRDEIEKRVRDLLAELVPGRVESRYLAETEKPLDRTFDAADESTAELTFEESDELFGRE